MLSTLPVFFRISPKENSDKKCFCFTCYIKVFFFFFFSKKVQFPCQISVDIGQTVEIKLRF